MVKIIIFQCSIHTNCLHDTEVRVCEIISWLNLKLALSWGRFVESQSFVYFKELNNYYLVISALINQL